MTCDRFLSFLQEENKVMTKITSSYKTRRGYVPNCNDDKWLEEFGAIPMTKWITTERYKGKKEV